jgi:four helix bundle protein
VETKAQCHQATGENERGAAVKMVKSVRDLHVYQLAFDLQQRVYEITKSFPRKELFSLTDQIRRSSRSVGAQICEAWKKRRYPAGFITKLTDSDAEQAETCHWLRTSEACEYISRGTCDELTAEYKHVSGMLNKMMHNADSWCKHYLREGQDVEGGKRDGL